MVCSQQQKKGACHMAAQPQQPIFPNELKFELDRLFSRITAYVDARFDGVMTQMRVDKQEAIARDEAIQQESLARDKELLQRVINAEATQQIILETLRTVQQQMQEGFAAQAERHNELMVRVERLERRNNPPATD
jgi:uncharacterized protein involved in exopolysaccharide biosynthesis